MNKRRRRKAKARRKHHRDFAIALWSIDLSMPPLIEANGESCLGRAVAETKHPSVADVDQAPRRKRGDGGSTPPVRATHAELRVAEASALNGDSAAC